MPRDRQAPTVASHSWWFVIVVAVSISGCRIGYELSDESTAGVDGLGGTSSHPASGGTDSGGAGPGSETGGAGQGGGESTGGSRASTGGSSSGGSSTGGSSSGGSSTGGTPAFTNETCTALSNCSCGVAPGSGHTYQLCGGAAATSRTSAGVNCLNAAAILAHVDSAEENALLLAEATKAGLLDEGHVFLAGSDILDEGEWRWSGIMQFWTGGGSGMATSMAFANWAAESPTDDDQKNCTVMNSSGQWVDESCSVSLPYICETQ